MSSSSNNVFQLLVIFSTFSAFDGLSEGFGVMKIISKSYLLFVFISTLCVFDCFGNVEVYVRNRCGKDINFKVYLKGYGLGYVKDEEEKDIKNRENRTLFRKDHFKIHVFHLSK